METGMEGQLRGVCRCVCMNCVVVHVYGVTTGSLGKVEFNDFSVSSRTRWVLMRSIPAGSATVTPLRKPLNGFHGTHCSLVSEDKVMRILTTVSPWHCVWLRRFYWSLLGFSPPTQEVQRSGWVTQHPPATDMDSEHSSRPDACQHGQTEFPEFLITVWQSFRSYSIKSLILLHALLGFSRISWSYVPNNQQKQHPAASVLIGISNAFLLNNRVKPVGAAPLPFKMSNSWVNLLPY